MTRPHGELSKPPSHETQLCPKPGISSKFHPNSILHHFSSPKALCILPRFYPFPPLNNCFHIIPSPTHGFLSQRLKTATVFLLSNSQIQQYSYSGYYGKVFSIVTFIKTLSVWPLSKILFHPSNSPWFSFSATQKHHGFLVVQSTFTDPFDIFSTFS